METLRILMQDPELAKSIKIEIKGEDLLAFGEFVHQRATETAEKNKEIKEEYLTARQFAEALKISMVSLWSYDKKGITHPLRVGNSKRYRRSDLEKIMRQNDTYTPTRS